MRLPSLRERGESRDLSTRHTMHNIYKLKEIRTNKKITKRQMSKILGISESYYSKIEAGQKRLFYDMAVKIALILETKPDKIFYIKN